MVTEYVMLNSESTLWVPGKWATISATLSANNVGFVWLKRISYGIETKENLDEYIIMYNNGDGVPDKTKLQGVLGEYLIISINDISAHRRNSLRVENMPMFVNPIG